MFILHNKFSRFIRHIVIRRIFFDIFKIGRVAFGFNKEYSKIKQYRNIHVGERCFILATGPSLTLDDVRKLKNDVKPIYL